MQAILWIACFSYVFHVLRKNINKMRKIFKS